MAALDQTSHYLTRTNSGTLYDKPGLDLLVVETGLCRAVISLQGAQVLEFTARGRAPLLWLSPTTVFAPGNAVRGGVPLCLPWFGENRSDPGKPKHGLVRNQLWELAGSEERADGTVVIEFCFRHPGDALFAASFDCVLKIGLGKDLSFGLSLTNTADVPAEYSWALHSYFAVADIGEVEVEGLSGVSYLDKTRGFARDTLSGVQAFSGEVDRVFEQAPARQKILTPNPISAESENCHTVITWNPGADLAATIDDIGAAFAGFVCVEHGNAFANSWQLQAGETASASLTLSR
ncbi:D-hexose-6-phosphate mutarotase [Microbulbifer hydrolyticus]|uniref:Putative glucose-6-phosphate 1-epimerase n=1 Tax=Microbulbifer hydrolyticus TaxID=48074 RepID=A0A6P1TE18_9GAMM|nr:D-hexose-6-phosphate mutarotase [Microbulbifer hydrolyticus]MBB5212253.1 glucose-6-phosphate 1-epimerase [Microbulbifer hydrolyticus]QHQ39905.1 D-hexose-6-phosphate mutarotase [Microbulbifer hydrolyticus]